MPFFKSDDIQNWTEGKWFNLNPKRSQIHGFSIDSRDIGKDFAFVAIKGQETAMISQPTPLQTAQPL
ncbi:MAG: hypothetical protein ACLUKN_01095 [Bacilli bacterium]